jgi:antitoxin component YwqK of YwqJK toxin-antitoxin module
MRTISKIYILFALLCCTTAAYSQCETILQDAETSFAGKDYNKAIKQYQAYKACNPHADVDAKISACKNKIESIKKPPLSPKNETIYYDKDWKVVSNRALAVFYREANYSEKKFKDYFITGELQATGGFISIDKVDDSNSVFDGEVVSYFKNGFMVKKSNFVNGKLSGLVTEFLENGNYLQSNFIDGNPGYNYYIYGNRDGRSSKMKYSDNTPLWESPSLSELKREKRNGVNWLYYIKNSLKVALANTTVEERSKWYKIDLLITNNSMVNINFDPALITVYSIDKKGKSQNLDVWTMEQYLKKASSVGAKLVEGYIKKTTIKSGETLRGFILIKRKKGVELYITIDIYGAKYSYKW